jgi:hypothetical protein
MRLPPSAQRCGRRCFTRPTEAPKQSGTRRGRRVVGALIGAALLPGACGKEAPPMHPGRPGAAVRAPQRLAHADHRRRIRR